MFEILFELRVDRGTWSEMVSGEVDGSDDGFLIRRVSTRTDEFDELEAKECEMQSMVLVKDLVGGS